MRVSGVAMCRRPMSRMSNSVFARVAVPLVVTVRVIVHRFHYTLLPYPLSTLFPDEAWRIDQPVLITHFDTYVPRIN
jgi:hypothetical protein